MIEAALSIPLISAVYLGMNELGNYIDVNRKLDNLTYEVGDVISRSTGTTATALNTVFSTSKDILHPYSADTLKARVAYYMIDSGSHLGTGTQLCWSYGYPSPAIPYTNVSVAAAGPGIVLPAFAGGAGGSAALKEPDSMPDNPTGYMTIDLEMTYNSVIHYVMPRTMRLTRLNYFYARGKNYVPFSTPPQNQGKSYNKDGTLAGCPTSKAAGALSDRRLKRDIHPVGKLANGLALYRFKYLWSNEEFVGVMAQEVLDVMPDAVVTGADGYMRVRYELLGTRMQRWDEWVKKTALDNATLAALTRASGRKRSEGTRLH